MRNRIFGLIGVLWGGAIILFKLLGQSPQGNPDGAYASGQAVGFVVGAAMFLVGGYYLLKRPSGK